MKMDEVEIPPQVFLDPWFHMCLKNAIETPALLKQLDRLYGTTLTERKTPVNTMVDKACGRDERDMKIFTGFIYECIYRRVPPPDGFRESVKEAFAEYLRDNPPEAK